MVEDSGCRDLSRGAGQRRYASPHFKYIKLNHRKQDCFLAPYRRTLVNEASFARSKFGDGSGWAVYLRGPVRDSECVCFIQISDCSSTHLTIRTETFSIENLRCS